MPAATSEEGNKALSERWRKTAVNRKVILAVAAIAMLLLAVATGYAYQRSSDLNSEISHLQYQNLALDNATSVQQALITELQGKLLLSENSTSTAVHNLTAIVDLNRSIILMNDSAVSQHAGNLSNPGFTFWNNFTAIHYAGYLVITIHSTNASDCLLEASWSAYGANVTQAWQFGSSSPSVLNDSLATLNIPGSAVLPVLPTSNLQIGVVNLGASESVENISIAYYF